MNMDYDSLARDYALHRQVHPGVLAGLVNTSQLDPTAYVLELGCGTGNYICAIQEMSGCTCNGIDPSTQMVAKARQRSQHVRFCLGRAEALAFPDASFDLVFSVDVIHHVVDRPALYTEAWRVLRPGGLVCTVTDSEDIIRSRQPLAHYFPEAVEPEVRRYPRISNLLQMMTSAGFINIVEGRVEFRSSLRDIQAYRDRAFSSLYLITQEAFEGGIQRMEADLVNGPIPLVSRYLLLWGEKS
jgi:ubiquinone/menaquinone biosynthesis C-methylase UbiE